MHFFNDCLFVYSLSHLSAPECALTSIPTQAQHVGNLCKRNWSTLNKKSLPGARHFEIKNTSSHSALVPGTRKGTPKCRAECRAGAVAFTAGKSHSLFYLFPSIRRHPAAKEGGLEELHSGERERVASLILMGFLEVPPSLRRCTQRALRINRGGARDSLLY